MRTVHWLVGCTLCIAGIGNVSAASAESQDLDNGSRVSVHDSNTGGGDVTGLSRDCPSAGGGSAGTSSDSAHASGSSSTPTPSHRPHLGWQSLLPGSIQ